MLSQVETLNQTVSLRTNTLYKGMNPSLIPFMENFFFYISPRAFEDSNILARFSTFNPKHLILI